MATKRVGPDRKKVKRHARAILGTPPASKVIVPKTERKPKHKKDPRSQDEV